MSDRIEVFDLTGPDGTIHTIEQNHDTGSRKTIARRPGPKSDLRGLEVSHAPAVRPRTEQTDEWPGHSE